MVAFAHNYSASNNSFQGHQTGQLYAHPYDVAYGYSHTDDRDKIVIVAGRPALHLTTAFEKDGHVQLRETGMNERQPISPLL